MTYNDTRTIWDIGNKVNLNSSTWLHYFYQIQFCLFSIIILQTFGFHIDLTFNVMFDH